MPSRQVGQIPLTMERLVSDASRPCDIATGNRRVLERLERGVWLLAMESRSNAAGTHSGEARRPKCGQSSHRRPGWMIVVSILGSPARWMGTVDQPPGRRPIRARLDAGRPAGSSSTGRNPAVDIVPPPPTPPSILAVESPADRPDDRAAAGERPEPELNVARQRILEAAAHAAACRGLFPPLDQPRHELRHAHRRACSNPTATSCP